MIPHCKTEEKYKVSKVLLSAYLHHSDFLDITSEAVADQIGTFIRARAKGCVNGGFSVSILDAKFATLILTDTYTSSSAHEGTNMV